MLKFGLPDKTIATIQTILAEEAELQKAILYGSRAKGTYKNGSDIDLTLIGNTLTESTRMRLAHKLSDASIPYQVDLSLWDHIDNDDLKDHIRRVGQVFYERPTITRQELKRSPK